MKTRKMLASDCEWKHSQSDVLALNLVEGEVDSGKKYFTELSRLSRTNKVREGESVYVLVTRRLPAQTAAHEIALIR